MENYKIVDYKFNFDLKKNCKLIDEKGINLEDVISALKAGKVLDVIEHPNKKRYPQQKIYIIELNNYVLEVPFIRNGSEIFLKTAYPSRKMTNKYLKENFLKGESVK